MLSPRGTRVLLIAAIAVLAALLALLTWLFFDLAEDAPRLDPGTDSALTWVRSIYGFGPAADEQLYLPSSVAIAPDGDIYATDPVRARVMRFTPAGEFRALVHTGAGGYVAGQFIRPEAVGVDALNGELYIADSWANKVIVFSADGEYEREWPLGSQARGVAIAGDRVFVLGQGSITVFTKEGDRIREWGTRGSDPGQIDAYLGIAASDDTVFLADSYNRRIQAFSYLGELKWATPSRPETRTAGSMEETASADEFAWDLPQDLCIDGAGRLVVADAFRFQLVVVDPETGEALGTYGDFGRQDGEFHYPTSVDYDAERDWFVVADTGNNRVQIVRIPDSDGDVLAPVRRAASSPARFAALPAVLLLVSLCVALYAFRRMKRWTAG